MAKLTRDQLEKFNGKCKNGFSLDLFFFCTWGEKRCRKIVKIGDDSIIYEVIVEFYDKYESFKKAGSVPTLIINKCVPTGTDGVYMVTRKTVKTLQELTEGYTDEKLVDMIKMLIAA